jgi:hypothetical protein
MWDDKRGFVDNAIDAVARAMTTGDPAVDMRARVLARIDVAATLKSRRAAIWMVPAAIAILLVIAVGVTRQASRPAAVPTRQTAQQATPEEPRAPAIEQPLEQVRSEPTTRRRVKRPLEPEHAPSVVASLAPPPLTVAQLGIAPMESGRSIELSEITVSPIEVAPLSIDDRP